MAIVNPSVQGWLAGLSEAIRMTTVRISACTPGHMEPNRMGVLQSRALRASALTERKRLVATIPRMAYTSTLY